MMLRSKANPRATRIYIEEVTRPFMMQVAAVSIDPTFIKNSLLQMQQAVLE